jgi:hypothetical protein
MGLFKEGGEHRIQDLGDDRYSMTISIPTDEDGRMARSCPSSECSPGYFKVTPGTGITDGQSVAYCPYCRHEDEPNDFSTEEQIRYAKDMALREAHKGVDDMIRDTLGLGASGKKKLGGGFISMEMSYKSSSLPFVHRPFEDEVRRDVICPYCTLDQTVFGLATWCADCGEDIFLIHIEAELAVTHLMLEDVERRQTQLGKRVAAKDLENCLEDAVSIFEASMRAIVRRALILRGDSSNQIELSFKKLGNAFQNIGRVRKELHSMFGLDPLEEAISEKLKSAFEKRHPITHNLGVVDRKYLERAKELEQEGREIRLTAIEITEVLADIQNAISLTYEGLIQNSAKLPAS